MRNSRTSEFEEEYYSLLELARKKDLKSEAKDLINSYYEVRKLQDSGFGKLNIDHAKIFNEYGKAKSRIKQYED